MNRFKEIAVLILMVLLSACTTTYVKSNPPAEFSVAARLLAQSLVAQLKNNEQANLFSSRSFVIDPFIDGDTGDVTKASLEIASIIATVLTEPPNNFKILTLDAVNVNAANYAVVGSTKYEPYEGTIRKN